MNRDYFNQEIIQILEDGKVENQNINNCELIKIIILDETINVSLFEKFKSNYETLYGNDQDFFVMKIQDLVYRVNILINDILLESGIPKEKLHNIIYHYVENEMIDFYSAVNYNEDDIFDMRDTYESEGVYIK